MNKLAAAQAFAKNRSEEGELDLWGEFVVPLYFDKLSLDEIRKPIVFEGGRGCGKTTLLRYLSHATQLSQKRQITKETLPKQLGLYLRADTRYLRAFQGEALTPDNWQKAFEHDICLIIVTELLSALNALITPNRIAEFGEVQKVRLTSFTDFISDGPVEPSAMLTYVKSMRNHLAMWLNNPEDYRKPQFLPLKQVILTLIDDIRAQAPQLSSTVFFVYLDEYENLLPYQMRVINTHLKHSGDPLVFHVATKRNGMATRETLSEERIQQSHDFNVFDVEAHLEPDFQLFAAELFCFRLRKKGFKIGPDAISTELLCSPSDLSRRREDEVYKRVTIEAARRILPRRRRVEAARSVLKEGGLRNKLKQQLDEVLGRAKDSLKADLFLRDDVPIESVCTGALLHQGKDPRMVLSELEKAAAGEVSKFKTADWSHTYFQGCLYYLYLPQQKPCILYAGFDAFLSISKENARHFLELCHLTMLNVELTADGDIMPVDPEKQAAAARSASAVFMKETQGSGQYGNRLFHVANTLGQIFRLSHSRPSQSEAERTHFSISSGELGDEATTILSECIKWSVLFTAKETKVKDIKLASEDFVLNPIFAPHFGISYNKGRKLEIKADDATRLLRGSRDEMNLLVRGYQKSWQLDEGEQINLFSQGDA
jgi:hypothetical protein